MVNTVIAFTSRYTTDAADSAGLTAEAGKSQAPSLNLMLRLAVEAPAVGVPRLRGFGRPRQAMSLASPELAP